MRSFCYPECYTAGRQAFTSGKTIAMHMAGLEGGWQVAVLQVVEKEVKEAQKEA